MADAEDVGDRRRGGDGHRVAVAHAVFRDGFAHGRPVHLRAAIHREVAAALLLEQFDGVDGQQSARPFGAFVRFVRAALGCQLAGGEDGVVGNHFHAAIGKGHRLFARVRDAQFIKRILKRHHAHAHGAVAHIRRARLGRGVVVDVDHVVQHTDGRAHGAGDEFLIEFAVLDMRGEIHRAEIAHRGFFGAGVEQNFRAKIRAVHHTHVILRRAHIRGILERDPRMPRFEKAHQHFAPEIFRLNGFGVWNLGVVQRIWFGYELVRVVCLPEALQA